MISFDDNKFTLGVFIDLSKAFDTVDHQILLNKLKHYGIHDKNLKWFSNYLSDRKQYIQYDQINKTDCLKVKCGGSATFDFRTVTISPIY